MTSATPRVLIYGSGEYAQMLRLHLPQYGQGFAGFIDDFSSGPEVIGTLLDASARSPGERLVLGIGYRSLSAREACAQRALDLGLEFATLIHPKALVADVACVGQGAVVMAGAYVDASARLGPFGVMWPNSVLSHDSVVGSHSFLSPSATVCGFVSVGARCFIGANAVLVDHQTVAGDQFIKAGVVLAQRNPRPA